MTPEERRSTTKYHHFPNSMQGAAVHMSHSAALASQPEPWSVLLLTCRDPKSDFRFALAQELQALGHDVTYVFLKRRPVVVRMATPEDAQAFSLPAFLATMRLAFRGRRRLLVFNSTNLAFPGLSRVLRKLCGGLWCLDMHDDLLYESRGLSRAKGRFGLKLLTSGSDFIVHAAPTLQELFRSSIPLGNASAIGHIDRSAVDLSRVLVLASLDGRFDFAFMGATAAASPEITFDIFGQVSRGDPTIAAALSTLIKSHPNVVYQGAYVNEDLPRILSGYAVTLAPYVVGSRLTYYIDPLRYYHCLNSGMEVLSTPIPKALNFGDALHIVWSPTEVVPLLQRLASDVATHRNTVERWRVRDWKGRALRLIEIAEEQQRTKGG